MKVLTKQFGEINYNEDQVIHFENGIIGFEKYRGFLLIDEEDYEPFRWLVSTKDNGVCFPVLNPFLSVPDYGKELPKTLVKKVFSAAEPLDMFCIVSFHGGEGGVTMNLKSPIIIDPVARSGEQKVLAAESIPVAYPLRQVAEADYR